jgi:hypothetical protein
MSAEEPGSISRWIPGLKVGRPGAVEAIWRRYYDRVLAVARHRLRRGPPPVIQDDEDVALSALLGLADGAARGRFDRLDDRSDLWQLLAAITVKKAMSRRRWYDRWKRSGNDGFILSWEVKTGHRGPAVMVHPDGVRAIAISPDGRWLASGGYDRSVRIRDIAGGREVHTLLGHSASVDALAFSPDGRRLASASRDRTVRVWDPAFGLGVQGLRGHVGSIWGAAFSPDGARIASAGEDHTVRLWEADAGPRPAEDPAAR